MINKHSIAGRLVVSKTIGFIIGVLAIFTLLLISIETTLEFKLGFVLLIMMMSVMIGLLGVFSEHPMFPGFKLRWWSRGPVVGISFFLILVLFAQDELGPFMSLDIVASMGLTSPYWALLDGAALGGLIGYITTKVCGEGNLPLK